MNNLIDSIKRTASHFYEQLPSLKSEKTQKAVSMALTALSVALILASPYLALKSRALPAIASAVAGVHGLALGILLRK